MTREEKIQLALGTATSYIVQFVFGDVRSDAYEVYMTIVVASTKKQAYQKAYRKAIKSGKWQKGFTGYQASNDPDVVQWEPIAYYARKSEKGCRLLSRRTKEV
ncbi:hypothetical protein KKH23_07355 [Patescibacteria group bacterium]|nr:hypothetical protein [Patescibacteria group bacterium]